MIPLGPSQTQKKQLKWWWLILLSCREMPSVYGNDLPCNQQQVLPGTPITVSPSPAGWPGPQVVGEVTLPLPQPHSKGISFTENTRFQIKTCAAVSTLPRAWTSEHSSPKGLCPHTVPLCSSAYTCFFQRHFLHRQHCCPQQPALLSASPSPFPCSVPTACNFQYFWLSWGSAEDLLLGLVAQR